MCFTAGDGNSYSGENPYARFIDKILTGDRLPYDMESLVSDLAQYAEFIDVKDKMMKSSMDDALAAS